ncbi:MAG: hypothetical protein ACYSYV_01085 [Planctomycetota bacterium]
MRSERVWPKPSAESTFLSPDEVALAGISSDANVWAARRLAQKIDSSIIAVLPGSAAPYFRAALL